MSDDEGFNGYATRETWAAHLWLSSDEPLYLRVKEVVEREDDVRAAASALSSWYEDLWHDIVQTKDGRTMAWDIGSAWRIDWEEVAAAFTE